MKQDKIVEKVLQIVSEDEALNIVQELIRIPSHWAQESRERPIAEFLHKLFNDEDIQAELVDVVDDRPNIISKLPGNGGGKSIMLNGHIDTVPTFGMDAPFDAEVRNGKLYGRGAADMKSGVGTMAYAMILLKRLGVKLKGDVYFAGVIDEDAAGSAGTRDIISRGPHTDYAIVGEPTSLRPVIAHKGIDYFEVIFTGRSVHSSTPKNGANAVFAAAEFINLIEKGMIPRYNQIKHPFLTSPAANPGLVIGAAQANMSFLLRKTPTYAGIIPDVCSVYFDVRWVPSQSAPEILSELEDYAELTVRHRDGISFQAKYIPIPRPAMEIEENNPLVISIQKNTAAVCGKAAAVSGENYWGDSGLLYGLAKIPTIMFGPGDIGCAHCDVEYVKVEELAKATAVYMLTILDICGFEKDKNNE